MCLRQLNRFIRALVCTSVNEGDINCVVVHCRAKGLDHGSRDRKLPNRKGCAWGADGGVLEMVMAASGESIVVC